MDPGCPLVRSGVVARRTARNTCRSVAWTALFIEEKGSVGEGFGLRWAGICCGFPQRGPVGVRVRGFFVRRSPLLQAVVHLSASDCFGGELLSILGCRLCRLFTASSG